MSEDNHSANLLRSQNYFIVGNAVYLVRRVSPLDVRWQTGPCSVELADDKLWPSVKPLAKNLSVWWRPIKIVSSPGSSRPISFQSIKGLTCDTATQHWLFCSLSLWEKLKYFIKCEWIPKQPPLISQTPKQWDSTPVVMLHYVENEILQMSLQLLINWLWVSQTGD